MHDKFSKARVVKRPELITIQTCHRAVANHRLKDDKQKILATSNLLFQCAELFLETQLHASDKT